MHLYIYLIYQLYVLLRAQAEEILQSPCPEVFRYELVDRPKDSVYGTTRGVITVRSKLPVTIKVMFQLPVVLTDDYLGTLKPKDSNFNIKEIHNPGYTPELVYYMDFQKNLPIPSVIQILLNDRQLCSSAPISGPRGQTTIYRFYNITARQNHYYYDQTNKVKKVVESPQDFTEHEPKFEKIPYSPKIPGTPRTPSLNKKIFPWQIPGFENCGLEYAVNPLIIGGAELEKQQVPWMVPLYKKVRNELNFVCTSNLISKKYLVTAAHCVWNYGKPQENLYTAFVGLYNVNEWPGENSQIRGISRFHIPPNYKGDVDYDVALLKLSQEVELNLSVNTVCIWNQEALGLVADTEPMVYGWGKPDHDTDVSGIPRAIRMPIVSQETCIKSNHRFIYSISDRTLCAGLRNGQGPCNGDSGGGLILPVTDEKSNSSRWVLRGITSSALKTTSNRCDTSNYIIFSDLAKYEDWILGVIMKD